MIRVGAKKMRWPWPKKAGDEERIDPPGLIHEPIGHGVGCYRVRGETLDDIERRRDPTVRYRTLDPWDQVE